jgi:hypothetical protein
LLDFKLKEYRKAAKMVVADASDRRRWEKVGVRNMMRRSGLSQKAVYAIVSSQPIRRANRASFRQAMNI